MKPFCFPWIAFKRTIPTTTTKSSNGQRENDRSCRHIDSHVIGNSNIFSASVQYIRKFAAAGPGAGRIATNIYTCIYTDGGGGVTSQVWGSLRLAPINYWLFFCPDRGIFHLFFFLMVFFESCTFSSWHVWILGCLGSFEPIVVFSCHLVADAIIALFSCSFERACSSSCALFTICSSLHVWICGCLNPSFSWELRPF